jgi:N,N'-diacetylchitobiose transport system permease protein
VIWDFNVFNQIWILTQGGPRLGTTTLGIWSFISAFSSESYGQGAAIAVVSV